MPKKDLASKDVLTQIAREHLFVDTLETRNSDSLDFYDLSVASLKKALSAAFDAGVDHALRQATRNTEQPRS